MSVPGTTAPAGLRLDKLLWYLRLAKSRSAAQALIATAMVRIDGRRAEKSGILVHAGATLTLPTIGRDASSLVVRIITLPLRRGPASEAASCYAIIAAQTESDSQPPAPS